MTTKRKREVEYRKHTEEHYEKNARSIAWEKGVKIKVENHTGYIDGKPVSNNHHPWYRLWFVLKYGDIRPSQIVHG